LDKTSRATLYTANPKSRFVCRLAPVPCPRLHTFHPLSAVRRFTYGSWFIVTPGLTGEGGSARDGHLRLAVRRSWVSHRESASISLGPPNLPM